MKLIILLSAMFFMARNMLATKSLSPKDKKKVIDEQSLVGQEIKDTINNTVDKLKQLIKLEETNFYLLSGLNRTKEIEIQENLSIERLIKLEKELEELINKSESLNIKTMTKEEIKPTLSEEEEPEEEEPEEEESEEEEPEEEEPEEEEPEEEEQEGEESYTLAEETGETSPSSKTSAFEEEPEKEDILTAASEPSKSDISGEATTSTKGLQPENVIGKTKRKESEVSSELRPTTKAIEPQKFKELGGISPEGEDLSETEKEKKSKKVSPEQTSATVSHGSSVPTGETTKTSPDAENVLKADDEKQKKNTPGADTIKNKVETPNRITEFLWLLLIMSIIIVVFSILWVLLK